MKPLLFRRILISYLLITPLLLLSLELYLSSSIKDNYISNLRASLMTQALLIADRIPPSFTHNLDDFCKSVKEKTGARVTIIDSSGRVLGDSDEPSEKMENHSDRPEIQDAAVSDAGSSIRYSKTLRKDLFYLAISINSVPDKRFLRLSMPLYDVQKAMNTIRIRIIIASLAVTFIVILFGLIQTRRVTKSIEGITDFSKEVAAGHFKKRLFLKEKDELGELGRNISNMARDLSARLIQTEEEKGKFEAILRNMSDGLILTDTKGTILLINAAVRNLFSIQSDITGKTLTEALRNADLMELIESVVEKKEKVSSEIKITRPGDLYILATATPFYSPKPENELSGVVLLFHDITRLRKLEEMRKDFVANVSHEIKTPITAIKGFAETLIEGALNDRDNALKFLGTIRNHSERLNSLVNDLLTLSGIELGDILITKKTFNLNEIIDTVFATLQEKAQAKGLYLRKEAAPEIMEIDADRDRLIQILINLIDNGIKFTDTGGITINVKSERLKVNGEEEIKFTKISVEDTGIGIPKKHLPRIGERFYRVDSARSRELGGTGLGLAIVKHLVKAHGWEMKIESTEGQGTTVHIICPYG
jgi:two-component system, OmpR family, phosphate regulon sensor histidine kinase PhoR